MREDLEWNELHDARLSSECELTWQPEPELSLVRHLLARHLGVTVDAIAAHHRLSLDLGLSLLSVVLVVLDVQELSPVQLTFDEVRGLHTVGQFAALVRARRHHPRAVADATRSSTA